MLRLIAMHYCICMTCHAKLLIYIDSLCHRCNCNHRLQTVVHKKIIDSFNFYLYNYLLFVNSWQKLPLKDIFWVKLRFITNDWISILYGGQVGANVSQTKRRRVNLVCVIVTYVWYFFSEEFSFKVRKRIFFKLIFCKNKS